MQKDELKGGKSDKISLEDIAKKHNVSLDSIEDQIKIGKEIEMEHVDDIKLAEEIAKDHLDEIPDYYTRLEKMEKEAKKDLKLESKRLMALAGIKEGDKKFLTNESFSGENPLKLQQVIAIKNKENGEWESLEENEKDSEDFTVFELNQKDFEPGQDDNALYKLG